MAKITMVQAINDALSEEMERDKSVLVFGEDSGAAGGVFRVTEGLQEKFGEERCFDTPLAEAAIVGFAIGLATAGFRPIAEMQFMGFMYPGFDQMASHAARMRWRSQGGLTVPMILRMPFGGGVRALEHHSESYETLFAHTPGLQIVIPSGPYNAKGLMKAAIRSNDPVVYLEPKRIYRAVKEEVPEEDYVVEIGKANVVNEGVDVTVVTWGAYFHDVKKVVAKLAGEGVSIELIDLQSISPLDSETILKSVRKTGRLVIVHEAPKTCGVGAEISAICNERAMLYMKAPIVRVTGFDTIMPFLQTEHYYLPSEERIEKGIRDVLQF